MRPNATTRLHNTIFNTMELPSLEERRSARRVLGRDRFHQLNRGRTQDHHEERGEDQEYERERELDSRLSRHLLRPLTALRPHRLGVRPERLRWMTAPSMSW